MRGFEGPDRIACWGEASECGRYSLKTLKIYDRPMFVTLLDVSHLT
jgi:hypothetical protein